MDPSAIRLLRCVGGSARRGRFVGNDVPHTLPYGRGSETRRLGGGRGAIWGGTVPSHHLASEPFIDARRPLTFERLPRTGGTRYP